MFLIDESQNSTIKDSQKKALHADLRIFWSQILTKDAGL